MQNNLLNLKNKLRTELSKLSEEFRLKTIEVFDFYKKNKRAAEK